TVRSASCVVRSKEADFSLLQTKHYGRRTGKMTRARSGKTVIRRRKRHRKLTKGFRASRHNLYRQSLVTLIRARVYAFRDRRARKRDFRRLWIVRVNAACRMRGLRYSELMHGLQLANVELNRQTLADIAI